MQIFGWSLEQYEYAKSEHTRINGVSIVADANGLLELKKWWQGTNRPEPLSVKIAGVATCDTVAREWAATAFRKAIIYLGR